MGFEPKQLVPEVRALPTELANFLGSQHNYNQTTISQSSLLVRRLAQPPVQFVWSKRPWLSHPDPGTARVSCSTLVSEIRFKVEKHPGRKRKKNKNCNSLLRITEIDNRWPRKMVASGYNVMDMPPSWLGGIPVNTKTRILQDGTGYDTDAMGWKWIPIPGIGQVLSIHV